MTQKLLVLPWSSARGLPGFMHDFRLACQRNRRNAWDVPVARNRVLVVPRLGPGGVCHVGYVDARANPNANELAQQFADEHARAFQCGKDKPVVSGKTSAGLSMPGGD